MRIRTVVSLVAVALCATTASAQRRTTPAITTAGATPTALELGVDATADIGLSGDSNTDIAIP